MSNPEKISITFRISNIEVTSFNLNVKELNVLPETLTFDISTILSFITKEKKIKWDINSKIFLEPEKKTLIGETVTSFTYDIINFVDLIRIREDGKIEAPDTLLYLLLQSSLDTTRGILFSRFSGTPLEKSYFPLVQSKTFVDQILQRSEKIGS